MKIQFIPYEDGSKQKAVEGAGNILNLDFAKPRPVGQVLPDWFKHLIWDPVLNFLQNIPFKKL